MSQAWVENLKRAVYIAEKDIKIYFLKGPNLIFGLLLPVSLFISFSIGRTVDLTFAIPGLIAIAAFFGAGAIQAISLPLERRTGTFNLLLTAPISLFAIVLGKALAGFIYITANALELADRAGFNTTLDLIIGVLLVLLVLGAAQQAMGWGAMHRH